jgi:hypothetical protein
MGQHRTRHGQPDLVLDAHHERGLTTAVLNVNGLL